MIMQEVHHTELDEWIRQNHYLNSTPAGAVLRLEFLENGDRIGAMLWGRPVAPKLDQRRLLQLTRMYFLDNTEHCAESKALSMARKYIRKHYPTVKGLITYASSGAGHEGIIYQADGWFKIGESKTTGRGWESRSGRVVRDSSTKLIFVKTP